MLDWRPRIELYSYAEYQSALDNTLAQLIKTMPNPDDAFREWQQVRAQLRMLYPDYHREEIRRKARDDI